MSEIIRLDNVSKFYYSKGQIATGFTRVNLSFNMGEFVAITGESGSGKSTLLNVITGLDTYEEGELYINGLETSHYGVKEYEEYRRKYIGIIFQNFNLIGSYTVLENVELVLKINGIDDAKIRDKSLELVDKVGLSKWKNTKVSKLSGGQKQRVAIARALAKDTPIIVADEPTGSLDSEQASEIIKLLYTISRDKLVIIVTHNYDQVSDYVTRKIRMHDGRVMDDIKLREYKEVLNFKEMEIRKMTYLNRFKMGIKNTFNIPSKFFLILLVYMFIVAALMSEYIIFKSEERNFSLSGRNDIFLNSSADRIVLFKKDKGEISLDDINKLRGIDNIKEVVKNDLLIDEELSFVTENEMWYTTRINNDYNYRSDSVIDSNNLGNNEAYLVVNLDNVYESVEEIEECILNKNIFLQLDTSGFDIDRSMPVKIVDVKYDNLGENGFDTSLYVSDNVSSVLSNFVNKNYAKTNILFRDRYYKSNSDITYFKLIPTDRVAGGAVYISDDLASNCKNDNCVGERVEITSNSKYYNSYLNLGISNMYNNKNYATLVGYGSYDDYNGALFINPGDYYNLFKSGTYQISIYVDNVDRIDFVAVEVDKLGYKALVLKDTFVKNEELEKVKMLRNMITLLLIVVLFFISYFVIRIILKSRNVYFSILRILGMNGFVSFEILFIELACVAVISYLIIIGGLFLFGSGIRDTLVYFSLFDYIYIFLILIFISFLISETYASKLFMKSAMLTIKEES